MNTTRTAYGEPGAHHLLSLREAAQRLGVSERFLRLEIAHGELATVKLGRRRLVDPVDLETYIAQHREGRQA